RANNLRIVCDLLSSTTRFIAHPAAAADSWKREKMDDLILMRESAMAAEGKVGLMMNVRKVDAEKVLGVLPALQTPTESPLADPAWLALNTIIDEDTVRHLIPRLKAAGACGIVEYPLNKIIDGRGMFLPVACLKSGQLFQATGAAAATDVACPGCKGTTLALPVAAMPAAPQEPLSLDD